MSRVAAEICKIFLTFRLRTSSPKSSGFPLFFSSPARYEQKSSRGKYRVTDDCQHPPPNA